MPADAPTSAHADSADQKPPGWSAAPAEVPRERPGVVPGMAPGDLPGEHPGAAPTGDQSRTEDRDWSVWWGVCTGSPGARIQVWRVQPNGLNAARPLLVVTAEDAEREGLASRAGFLAYLADRFGPGRYRLSPRLPSGEKPRGAPSLTVVIPEPTAPELVMRPPTPSPVPMTTATPADRETLIEVERMRLVAEREREREEARERHRQEREDRRREREETRERRRQEAAARAEAEERRRAERDERMQATLLSMMKDVAAAGRREPDPLTQALLTKVLERQENRTDLSEFIKTQAEMGRLNAQTMMDQWRTMMQMSTETQARLISQAVETASQRDGGGFWDAAGSAIAQALPVKGM